MRPVKQEARDPLKGYLPFYSVDTREEADALVELALERGEFFRQSDGTIIESTLLVEQTLENLELAGERLAALHKELQCRTSE